LVLSRSERFVLRFVGAERSRVGGLPMAFLLFPAEDVGVYVLPLMIFHIIQLLVCAVIAKHYARLAVEEEEQSAASTTGDENRAAPDAGGNSAVDSAESAHRR